MFGRSGHLRNLVQDSSLAKEAEKASAFVMNACALGGKLAELEVLVNGCEDESHIAEFRTLQKDFGAINHEYLHQPVHAALKRCFVNGVCHKEFTAAERETLTSFADVANKCIQQYAKLKVLVEAQRTLIALRQSEPNEEKALLKGNMVVQDEPMAVTPSAPQLEMPPPYETPEAPVNVETAPTASKFEALKQAMRKKELEKEQLESLKKLEVERFKAEATRRLQSAEREQQRLKASYQEFLQKSQALEAQSRNEITDITFEIGMYIFEHQDEMPFLKAIRFPFDKIDHLKEASYSEAYALAKSLATNFPNHAPKIQLIENSHRMAMGQLQAEYIDAIEAQKKSVEIASPSIVAPVRVSVPTAPVQRTPQHFSCEPTRLTTDVRHNCVPRVSKDGGVPPNCMMQVLWPSIGSDTAKKIIEDLNDSIFYGDGITYNMVEQSGEAYYRCLVAHAYINPHDLQSWPNKQAHIDYYIAEWAYHQYQTCDHELQSNHRKMDAKMVDVNQKYLTFYASIIACAANRATNVKPEYSSGRVFRGIESLQCTNASRCILDGLFANRQRAVDASDVLETLSMYHESIHRATKGMQEQMRANTVNFSEFNSSYLTLDALANAKLSSPRAYPAETVKTNASTLMVAAHLALDKYISENWYIYEKNPQVHACHRKATLHALDLICRRLVDYTVIRTGDPTWHVRTETLKNLDSANSICQYHWNRASKYETDLPALTDRYIHSGTADI